MKKVIFITSILGTFFFLYGTPEDAVIAFDLHGVVFDLDYGTMIKTALTHPQLFGQLPLLASRNFRKSLRNIRSETRVWEQIFDKLQQRHPTLKPHRQTFISLGNAQKPNKNMVQLLKDLRAHGYHLYILSNIGPEMLAELDQKYPSLMSLFLGRYTPTAENNYHHKPQPEFYDEFKHYLICQGHKNKRVIFIDDHHDNLEAATKAGFTSIKFTSAKKLRKTLGL